MKHPEFLQIHHVSLQVTDLERSLVFYQGVLGLQPDPQRPDLGYPGAWLNVAGQQLHLMQIEGSQTQVPLQHMGHERHVALQMENLETLQACLEQAGIEYRKSRSGREALFCRDPDNNTLEFVVKIR